MKKNSAIIWLSILTLISGCPRDIVPFPVKLEIATNTFDTGLPDCAKITEIELYEYELSPQNSKLVWKVMANPPHPSKDFLIKLCLVPNGFVQVVPNPEETYVIKSGYNYVLTIKSDIAYLGNIVFVAD